MNSQEKITNKHLDWLLRHLVSNEYGNRAEIDLTEEAQDLVGWGYASMNICGLGGYALRVGTSSKGMELLEKNYKVEYALFLLQVNQPNTALGLISTMSERELPAFLVHKEFPVRETAKQRLARLHMKLADRFLSLQTVIRKTGFSEDQILHYLITVFITKRFVYKVHHPPEPPELEMIEEHLLEVLDVATVSNYTWSVLGVTEFGAYILEEAGPRHLALACLRVGDANLTRTYIDSLKLEDLPEVLASENEVVRHTAQRVYDRLTSETN